VSTDKPPGETPQHGGARHGSRTEVNWDQGRGREPYANQGEEEAAPGSAAYEGGDRAEHSGRNLEQMEEVKKMP
jgi:hypothetical protein